MNNLNPVIQYENVPDVEVLEPIRRNVVFLAVKMFIVLVFADSIFALLILLTVAGLIPTEWTAAYILFLWIAHTIKDVFLTYTLINLVVSWVSTLYYVSGGHLIRQRGV